MFISAVAFLTVLSLLVLVHEYGHYRVARQLGVRVERFSIGFGRELFGWTRGETRFRISVIPFGGYVKLAGESDESGTGASWEYVSQPIFRRIAIVVAGVAANMLFAYLLFVWLSATGYPVLTTVVGGLVDGYPAQAAGVMAGDRVLVVNGVPTTSWDAMSRLIHEQTHGPIQLEVERGGSRVTVTIEPRITEGVDVVGRRARRGFIGIVPSDQTVMVRHPVWEAVVVGAERTWDVTRLTLWGLWGMITGQVSWRSVSGPIGIAYLSGHAARLGLVYLLHLMATISVNLAVVNLLPLPGLDGGHLLFLAAERIRGRPLSLRVQEVIQQAAMVLLILLMVAVTYNDVLNLMARQ